MTLGRAGDPESDLRDFARLQVRAGLLTSAQQYEELRAAVAAEMPRTDAAIMARAWLAAAGKDLDRLADAWPPVTDHDRLQAAFAECAEHDVPVLVGVADPTAVIGHLDAGRARPRGIVWFTPAEVWHAIDHGVLTVSVWRGDGTPVAADDPLLTAVLTCVERHGLAARLQGDQVQVATRWQRRRSLSAGP